MGHRNYGPFKTSGIDGIYPTLLQKGLQHLLDPVCEIYRASLALGYISYTWRVSRVTFMPKPGKMDYNKSEMVLFTRRYKPESLKTIKFFNNTLEASTQVQYLGVILVTACNANKIQSCQRWFTKRIKGLYGLDYQRRLAFLGWKAYRLEG